MTARFKSGGDYFEKKSGLTKKVLKLERGTPVPKRKKRTGHVGSAIMKARFCVTVERYRFEDSGDMYTLGVDGFDLDGALDGHLSGEVTMAVDPLSADDLTCWHMIEFDIGAGIDQPFSKAKVCAEKLDSLNIATILEVGQGGKGHYRLWMFHEEAVGAGPVTGALAKVLSTLIGEPVAVYPDPGGQAEFVTLPLQGESVLLQRGVFVNSVGKKIKDQHEHLESIETVKSASLHALIEDRDAGRKTESARPDEDEAVPAEISPDAEAPPEKAETKPETPEIPEETSETSADTSPAPSTPAAEESPYQPGTRLPGLKESGMPLPIDAPDTLVVFKLGGGSFGIDASVVRRIGAVSDVEPLPVSSETCMGSMRCGDSACSVHFGRPVFGLPRDGGDAAPGNVIVMTGEDGTVFGLAVDRVVEILRIPRSSAYETSSGDTPMVSGFLVLPGDGGRIGMAESLHVSRACMEREERPGREFSPDEVFLLFSRAGTLLAFPVTDVEEVGVLSSADEGRTEIDFHGRTIPHLDIPALFGPDATPPRSGNGGGRNRPRRMIVGKRADGMYSVAADTILGTGHLEEGSVHRLEKSGTVGSVGRYGLTGERVYILASGG